MVGADAILVAHAVPVGIDEGLGIRPGIEVAREGDGVERRARHIVGRREEPEVGGIGPEAEVEQTRVGGIGELEATLVAPGGRQALLTLALTSP